MAFHTDLQDLIQPSVRSTLSPLPPMTALQPRWQALSMRSGTSFFDTWAWTSSWIGLVEEERFLFAITDDGGRDLVLAILSRDPGNRSLWLNAPADKQARMIFCEYGDLLTETGFDGEPWALLWESLKGHTLNISGSLTSFTEIEEATGTRAMARQKRGAPFVQLEAVRNAGGQLDSLLSRNTRQQLSRAVRLEDAPQGIRLVVRKNGADAHMALERLIEFQHQSFQARGLESSFENPVFQTFTKSLIDSKTDDGHVELIECYSGDQILGVLFNLVKRDTVANYQSGFVTRKDSRAKPGYLAHKTAIEHYARAGYRRYSFLAGDSQYKYSLSTDSDVLYWTRLERPTLLNWAENSARRLTRRLIT